jgi:tetratricopeptide (TPR) repeat protein
MNFRSSLHPTLLTLLAVSFCIGQTAEPVSPSEKNPKAATLVRAAIMLEGAGEFEAAMAKYKEVLRIEPKDFAAMNSIAGLHGMLNQPADEIAWAQKAVDASPQFWEGYINLGNGLSMLGKFDQAITAYRKAAVIVPKDPLPIYSMGVVAENRDQIEEALKLYKQSVELDGKFENGLFSAAAMHARLKQFNEAKALLNRLLEVNPRDDEARQMLRAVEKEINRP